MKNRSFEVRSLLVAWARKDMATSSGSMPQPLSVTRMSFLPPSSSWISMRVAPASMEFSTSSLTTDAGRSITSPAAILFATRSGSSSIMPTMRRPSGG